MTTVLHGLPNPLPGERVLRVHPTIAPEVLDADWRRRSNFFTGRSVGPKALQVDQAEHAGRLAASGQLLSTGVVAGLEVTVEQEQDGSWTLEVAPGLGIAVSGEDVRLVRPLRLPVNALRVTLTRGGATENHTIGEWLGIDTPPEPEPAVTGAPASPLAVVLFLEPIEVRRVGEQDTGDACELDPNDIAFEDEQLVDGVRLRAIELPLPSSLQDEPHWRNQLAYQVFQQEAALGPGEVMAWEGTGVGVGLLGIRSVTSTRFVDVNAIAREGGQLNRRRALIGNPGTRQLWQARVRQFIDELADVGIGPVTDAGLASRFRFLPPVGTLPSEVLFPRADGIVALDVRGDRGEPHLPLPTSPLFPPGFVLEAVPVELESLDDFLRAAANMAPFDLQVFEQVQVLVPVPQRHFSPDLLRVEDETPDEFREAIRLFLLRLNHRLGRRADVRDGEQRLQDALFGSTPEHPSSDPAAVRGEADSRFPEDDDLPEGEIIPPPEERFADTIRTDILALGQRIASVVKPNPFAFLVEHLRAESANELPLTVPLVGIPEAGQRFVNDRSGGQGLVGFVQGMSKKLLAASEALDVSFTRAANELFRVRSLVSGEVEATQLASSPALPFVVKNRLTAVTPAQLSQFKTFIFPPPNTPARTVPTKTTTRPVQSQSIRISGAEDVPSAFVFTRTIRERLQAPLVLDAQDGAERAKRAVFRTLLTIHDSGLSLDELDFPGFLVDPAAILTGDPPLTVPTVPLGALVPRSVNIRWVRRFLEFFDSPATGADPYWPHDRLETGGDDESSFAATAIGSIEKAIASLRIAEGRLAAFDRGLTLARDRMSADLATWDRLQQRLRELEDEIADFRNDVLVARALEQEEIARAKRVNAERNQVLRDNVAFVVFRRPRTVDGLLASPTHVGAPALIPDPVPACLNSDFEAPDQLRGMVDLLREAPLIWSTLGTQLLPRVNRQVALRQIAAVALHRAANPAPVSYNPFDNSAFTDETGQRIRQVYESRRQALADLRATRLRFELAFFFRFSWIGLIPALLPVATLNDLILATHGRQEVSDRIAHHLDDINRVVACFFEHLRRVTPFTRLQWMEQLSQSQIPIDLRQLSVLPDWETVDPVEQRGMQGFVNWLYQQIRSEQTDALQFMHDLVRMTVLLASHGPINQALAARPVNVRPVSAGGVIEIGIEAERIRVGMQVLLFEADGPVPATGQGIIEDLSQGVAIVRVARTESDRSIVPVRAQLVEQDRNPGVELATGVVVGIGVVSSVA